MYDGDCKVLAWNSTAHHPSYSNVWCKRSECVCLTQIQIHSVYSDRCVACVEFPGHGLSSHLPKGVPYSPANDLQAMRAVVKHLGWSSFILMGKFFHLTFLVHSQTRLLSRATCPLAQRECIYVVTTVVELSVSNNMTCNSLKFLMPYEQCNGYLSHTDGQRYELYCES